MTTRKVGGVPMFTKGVRWAACLTVMILLTGATAGLRAAEPTGDEGAEHRLIGTWKLVSAKYGGQEMQFGDSTMVKHVTATHFMWANYQKNGVVTRAAGGTCSIKGDVYEELPEYGIGADFDLIKGQAQKFTWKVEGKKWYHTGELSNGLTIEEVWQRED